MAMAIIMKLKPKLWKTKTSPLLSCTHLLQCSSWSHFPYKDHNLLCEISEAINDSENEKDYYSKNPRLKQILPYLKPRHVSTLITLNPLSLSPSSLLSFFNHHASRPPFRHTLHSYCTMLHFLCLHRISSRSRFKVARICFVACARLVFDEIPKRGLRPTVVSFNTLISGCCKAGAVEEGFRLKGVMESERVCPDVFTFSALINGLCKEGRLDEGSLLFDEMCGKGLVPNGVTFTVLIDGQCKGGKVDLALKNFQMMLAQGVRPDLVTYNALINGLCKVGDLKEARRLVNEMSASGLRPDRITFTTLIDGCCKYGDMESALEIKRRMVEEGIELDDVAFTVLISGLL
ncbi:Putative pentatricopeptide repeat-containing protein [Glycine soja]|nr:Putative pentatricopeptide repeat-containing protein [Glycine soja]